MTPRQPLVLASLLCPSLQTQGEVMPQHYDFGYNVYQEDNNRMHIESYYVRCKVELNDATSFNFQWLNDAISGSSPDGGYDTGTPARLASGDDPAKGADPTLYNHDDPGYHPEVPSLPTKSTKSTFSKIHPDLRKGILGALARQFGDHRVELELSRSIEHDYISNGYALSDAWELNEKNTTLSYGINVLNDRVKMFNDNLHSDVYVPKHSYDWFTGVSQILDKNTVISANLTLGYNQGYLNDPYKIIQREEYTTAFVTPDPFNPIPGETTLDTYHKTAVDYPENRPDHRFRQVLQLEGKHYVEAADGVISGVLRFGHDDFGVTSQTVEVEWRQSIKDHLIVTPFVRFYHQSAANFFHNSLNEIYPSTRKTVADYTQEPDPFNPGGFILHSGLTDETNVVPNVPSGTGPNYSADYRLSSMDALSGGLKVNYKINDTFGASVSYERYVMSGCGGNAADRSPADAYPSADIWSFVVTAQF